MVLLPSYSCSYTNQVSQFLIYFLSMSLYGDISPFLEYLTSQRLLKTIICYSKTNLKVHLTFISLFFSNIYNINIVIYVKVFNIYNRIQ